MKQIIQGVGGGNWHASEKILANMNHEKHFYLEMIRELEEMGLEEVISKWLEKTNCEAYWVIGEDKIKVLKQSIIKKIHDKIDNLE